MPHAQTKNRPALVILDIGDADIVGSEGNDPTYQTPFDLTITGWQKAGLFAPSVVRLHKLATLEKALVRRHLGSLQPGDRELDLRIVGDGLIYQFNFLPWRFRPALPERSAGPVCPPP